MTTTTEPTILERLRERYTSPEIPSCRLCGGELTIGSMGGGNATVWACADAGFMPDKKYGPDHYRDSQWTQYRHGDHEVLAVLDALERVQGVLDAATAWHSKGVHVVAVNRVREALTIEESRG